MTGSGGRLPTGRSASVPPSAPAPRGAPPAPSIDPEDPLTTTSESTPSAPTSRLRRAPVERSHERVHFKDSLPFYLVNLSPILIVVTGISWQSVALLMITFWGRMFFITAGYHRYFSHKSFKLARVPQFLFAFGATSSAQKGPLWWAQHHRDHHRYSDTDLDVHSPQRGFWWSHVGWILVDSHAHTDFDKISDFAKYPELRWINKYDWVAPWSLAIACWLIGSWEGLVVGFFLSTVLLWHSTFFINSLAHVFGRRRYATEDTSRNSALLAVLTMGEGWHNNHHYYPASARQGFFWWEWDPTFYVLKGLSWVGIVKDLKAPPAHVKAASRVRDGNFDIGMFRVHWNKARLAVNAAGTNVAHALVERKDSAVEAFGETREAIHDRRTEVQAGIEARREALEGFVYSTLETAEELAQLSRRGQRDLARES
ncbi:MAG: acyl-CoA desaturase [Acidimicrobiales bacterium]|nr:acyl-CoA desaturase [Acidimicrobiales bacterium]